MKEKAVLVKPSNRIKDRSILGQILIYFVAAIIAFISLGSCIACKRRGLTIAAFTGHFPAVFFTGILCPFFIRKSMIFQFLCNMPAITDVQDGMLGFIHWGHSSFGGMFMILILIPTVSTGTGFASSVFGITVRFPLSI